MNKRTKTDRELLLDASLEFIMNSPEEVFDQYLKEAGEDGSELERRATDAIGAALARHESAAVSGSLAPAIQDKLEAQEAEIERLRAERAELRDVLLRNGFVPCDIPACNCGSWHHRYGLPERMQEIKDALAEAGHELSNANGNLTLNALKALVAERDELRRQLDECSQMLARQAATIRDLTRPAGPRG